MAWESLLKNILNPKCMECQSNLELLSGLDLSSKAIVLYEEEGLHMDIVEKEECIPYFGESSYEHHKIMRSTGDTQPNLYFSPRKGKNKLAQRTRAQVWEERRSKLLEYLCWMKGNPTLQEVSRELAIPGDYLMKLMHELPEVVEVFQGPQGHKSLRIKDGAVFEPEGHCGMKLKFEKGRLWEVHDDSYCPHFQAGYCKCFSYDCPSILGKFGDCKKVDFDEVKRWIESESGGM